MSLCPRQPRDSDGRERGCDSTEPLREAKLQERPLQELHAIWSLRFRCQVPVRSRSGWTSKANTRSAHQLIFSSLLLFLTDHWFALRPPSFPFLPATHSVSDPWRAFFSWHRAKGPELYLVICFQNYRDTRHHLVCHTSQGAITLSKISDTNRDKCVQKKSYLLFRGP